MSKLIEKLEWVAEWGGTKKRHCMLNSFGHILAFEHFRCSDARQSGMGGNHFVRCADRFRSCYRAYHGF